MLHLLSQIDPGDRAALGAALNAELAALTARGPRGDRTLVERAEHALREGAAACFDFAADGSATLRAAGRRFQAGRFETPTLGELRARAVAARERAGTPAARLRFWVLDGASPATDIGALQGAAPPGALFQVASQFNCLEAPDACIVDVADYFHDPTQGPRASISAFPGTLLRHYAAPGPGGARFVQRSPGPQLNLLEAVCAEGVARVDSGYLMTSNIARPELFAQALTERFDQLRVGVHDGVEVVFGGNWDGPVTADPPPTIAQVFTSSVAAGGYSRLDLADADTATIVGQLQRAAHEGTLLAAASLGKSFVLLTLIGGGVFGNPVPLVWAAILRAVDAVAPLLHRDLVVAVNGYSLGQRVPHAELQAAAQARGGALLLFERGAVRVA